MTSNRSNCTLSAIAAGTFDQNCHVLCKPAKWTDLALFYIGNYVAHAVTARNPAGQGTFGAITTILTALVFPVSGLLEGSRAIARLAIFAKTPLRCAARAGALYTVVEALKGDVVRRTLFQKLNIDGFFNFFLVWFGLSRSKISEIKLEDLVRTGLLGGGYDNVAVLNEALDDVDLRDIADLIRPQRVSLEIPQKPKFDLFKTNTFFKRKIHGRVSLPEGWKLLEVPPDAEFEDDDTMSEPATTIQLSQDYNFMKSAIALGQVLYAISTLYETRGSQVEQFGYAAFGFTVTPYAFMSIVNLLGNITCPGYPAMYIVESDELRRLRNLVASEGKELIFYVEGTVGRYKAPRREWRDFLGLLSEAHDRAYKAQRRVYQVAILALAGIHIGLIWSLSNFHPGDSTNTQRGWTMAWLGLGIFVGSGLGLWQLLLSSILYRDASLLIAAASGIYYGALAGGGFVVVGQMILQLGICEQI